MPAKSAVEEHANAKAAAEAAKAEAESLAAAKAAAEEALVPLAAAAVEAANEYVEADEQRNVAHLALGFRLLAVEAFLDSSVLEVSIGDWSESALPEVSGRPSGRPLPTAHCRQPESQPASAGPSAVLPPTRSGRCIV